MERIAIFSLLPEIWEFHIIPHMSPTDFHSIINSSPTWRGMLKNKSTNGLLPLVLPILLKHKSVTPESLLVWRGVSHAAKSLVDDILKEPTSAQAYFKSVTTVGAQWSPSVVDEEHYLRNVVEKINNKYDLRQTKNLRNFIAHQAVAASSNPFLTKSVQLCIVESMGYQDLATDILSRYGHTISSVTFNMLNASNSLVLQFLSHVPNLKVLKLNGKAPSTNIPVGWQRPQLTQLELLDINKLDNRECSPLCSHLLSFYCSQIRTLICSGELFLTSRNVSAINIKTLPNLRRLRVTINRAEEGSSFFDALQDLRSLPLTEFQFGTATNAQLCSTYKVLKVIGSFADTLLHFNLFLDPIPFPFSENMTNLLKEMRVMPKLTKFSTTLSNTLHQWFWAVVRIKCQLLEELDIHGEENISQEETSSLVQRFESMPTLQKITIHSGFSGEGGGGTPERIVITRDGKKVQVPVQSQRR